MLSFEFCRKFFWENLYNVNTENLTWDQDLTGDDLVPGVQSEQDIRSADSHIPKEVIERMRLFLLWANVTQYVTNTHSEISD